MHLRSPGGTELANVGPPGYEYWWQDCIELKFFRENVTHV